MGLKIFLATTIIKYNEQNEMFETIILINAAVCVCSLNKGGESEAVGLMGRMGG